MARDIVKLIKKDKEVVYGVAWTVEKPVGNVVIATGMEEHSLRYDDFAYFLNRHNYNVYCLDYYGQGQNVVLGRQQIGTVPQSAFRKYVYTLFEVIRKIEISTLPIYILGHSMGSLLVQDFIQRFGNHVKKAILIGTQGPSKLHSLGYRIAKLTTSKRSYNKPSKLLRNLSIGKYAKSVKNRRTSSDWISTDEKVVDAYVLDDLCGVPSSKGFYRELLKGTARIHKKNFVQKIPFNLPILIVGGKLDPVSNFTKSYDKLEKLYKKNGINNVEVLIYDYMRHEVLNEPDKHLVYDDILTFIEK